MPATLAEALEQDIQMLKFGQIVDLDLIERSAPGKYVQDSRDGVSHSHSHQTGVLNVIN